MPLRSYPASIEAESDTTLNVEAGANVPCIARDSAGTPVLSSYNSFDCLTVMPFSQIFKS